MQIRNNMAKEEAGTPALVVLNHCVVNRLCRAELPGVCFEKIGYFNGNCNTV